MRISGLFVLAVFFPAFAHASVVTNEIMFDPEGSDAGREWVEIYNNGSEPVTIIGGSSNNAWRFYEVHSSGPHNHTFGAEAYQGTLTLNPNEYAVVAQNGETFKTSYQNYTGTIVVSSAFSLGNTVQTIGLRIGPDGSIWSEVTYNADVMGGKGDGKSLQLVSGNWTAAAPTPGAANAGSSSPSSPESPPSDTASATTTNTPMAPASNSGGPPEYIPIPILSIIIGKDRTVSAGADTAFTALVYDSRGNKRDDAIVSWSFGDGMKRVGANVYHQYYEPGEYLSIVRATTPDGGDVFKEVTIIVKDASIKIASISARGISLANNSSRVLDLSLWRLSMGGKEFKIPTDTQILAGRTTLFPSQIIQLPLSDTATLLYPSGEVAAAYPEIKSTGSSMQPSADATSFSGVQTVRLGEASARQVEPIISTKANIKAYDEAVRAPVAATELAATGAALSAKVPAEQQKSGGLFKSPWFYSLLGVIGLAGTAFAFL